MIQSGPASALIRHKQILTNKQTDKLNTHAKYSMWCADHGYGNLLNHVYRLLFSDWLEKNRKVYSYWSIKQTIRRFSYWRFRDYSTNFYKSENNSFSKTPISRNWTLRFRYKCLLFKFGLCKQVFFYFDKNRNFNMSAYLHLQNPFTRK